MTVMLLQHTPFTRQKLLPPCTKTCTSDSNIATRRMTTTDKHKDSLQISCDNKAMRYYRLWIYTCNTVLFISVVAFAIVAGKIVVGDVRRYFVSGLSLWQPTFLYCYLALITQSGILQLIGCLGAIRLNERLLNTYWTLLLVLLCGDIIVGLVWIFRFDKIVEDYKPPLKHRLLTEYGTDTEFTALWDALQRDYKCCGVQGVQDFTNVNKTMTGATLNTNSEWLGTVTPPTVTTQVIPESCCKYSANSLEKKPIFQTALRSGSLQQLASPSSSSSENQSLSHVIIASQPERPETTVKALPEPCGDGVSYNVVGCETIITSWLKNCGEVLFVIWVCIIAFLKVCFVGILKYEIREMIQKIKVLHGEMRTPQLLLTEMDAGATTNTVNSPTANQHLQPLLSNHRETNAGSVVTESNGGIPVASRESPAGPVLLPPPDSVQTTPLHTSGAAHQRHLSLLNDGTDSDTNSNSALIIADDGGKSPRGKQSRNSNGNNNSYELHELHELNRLLARHHTEI